MKKAHVYGNFFFLFLTEFYIFVENSFASPAAAGGAE